MLLVERILQDPAGIAALLEQLKSSTAWQELTASTGTSNDNAELRTAPPVSGHSHSQVSLEVAEHDMQKGPQGLPSAAGSSVASLLSQLNSFSAGPHQSSVSNDFGHGYNEMGGPSTVKLQTLPSTGLPEGFEPPEDRSKLTFRQALPLVSGLVDDVSFITEINKV